MPEGMLTLDEVMQYLDIDRDEVEDLIREGKLHAYKVGGVYLRFKKSQVMNLKSHEMTPALDSSTLSKARDFWDYNNFYILTALFLVGLLVYVLR